MNHADEIVEDLIRHVFVKNASVSELDHVVLSALSSRHNPSGTYVMRISPKSGRPVFGHREVNSGQRIAIS